MVRFNFFSHENLKGQDPFKRLANANIKFWKAAENIAAGQRTAEEVYTSWMGSPGHRRNIEDCSLTYHGIGLARGAHTVPYGTISNAWTHDFIVPR